MNKFIFPIVGLSLVAIAAKIAANIAYKQTKMKIEQTKEDSWFYYLYSWF